MCAFADREGESGVWQSNMVWEWEKEWKEEKPKANGEENLRKTTILSLYNQRICVQAENVISLPYCV